MSDLIGFLRARRDEDEAAARAAQGRLPWSSAERNSSLFIETNGDYSMGWQFAGSSGIWTCDDPDDDCHLYRTSADAEARHIARHDPGRVLAEVAAKRAIIDRCEFAARWKGRRENTPAELAWAILVDLASIDSDHPDYDPAWQENH